MAAPVSHDEGFFSLGHGGSRIWTDNPSVEPVERQEVIKWAALELLLQEQAERQQLLDNALKSSQDDSEKLLLNIKERIDRVGIELPTVEVRFEHLSLFADVYVGDRALPSLINFTRDLVEGLLASCKILPSNKRPLTILQDVSGVIKPGRMTLLLGPPGEASQSVGVCFRYLYQKSCWNRIIHLTIRHRGRSFFTAFD